MSSFAQLAASTKDPQAWIDGWVEIRAYTALEPLKVVITEITSEHLIMEFEITDAARQPMGLLHGGVSMLLAETVASTHSAYICDISKVAPVGIEINGSHLRSATSGRIRVIGRVLRSTRSFIFHDIEVVHVETGNTLCSSRVTNYLKPHN